MMIFGLLPRLLSLFFATLTALLLVATSPFWLPLLTVRIWLELKEIKKKVSDDALVDPLKK